MIIGDLFAGVGGMSEGFRMAGFDVAFAIEYDKDIAASLKISPSEVSEALERCRKSTGAGGI